MAASEGYECIINFEHFFSSVTFTYPSAWGEGGVQMRWAEASWRARELPLLCRELHPGAGFVFIGGLRVESSNGFWSCALRIVGWRSVGVLWALAGYLGLAPAGWRTAWGGWFLFCASIGRIFVLAGTLSTGLLFYEVLRLS